MAKTSSETPATVTAVNPIMLDPAAQALRAHPEIPRDLRDRLVGGTGQRHRVPLELRRIPLRILTTLKATEQELDAAPPVEVGHDLCVVDGG
jgi:hypothetical protein